jgi:hypothetical protein
MTHDGALIAGALDNPALFGPHFRGESWTAWRAFVAALFAAPMTEEQVALFRTYTGRSTPPVEPFTEAALVVGRRGGKSRVLAFVAVALAVLRDYEEHLAAGEVATIGVLASTQKQGRSIFNYVLGLLRAIPSLASMIEAETADTILLSNRVQIEIAAASFRSTRGYTYAAVLADEVAFWRSEESLNPDVEILRALRPGLASIPGSIMMLASSPYGKKGALYNSYRRHYGKDDARVLVWKAPTEAMNPRIDPAIIQEAFDEDPESARAEYGAEFRDDLADFITREQIDAITCWGRHELPPEPGVAYRAFLDPSGGSSDSMCLAIAHQAGDRGVLDALLEIRPPFDPDRAVIDCVALLRRYSVSRAVSDHYGGLWPVARFAEHGITVEQSARPKSAIYQDFLPLANAARIELLDNKRLTAQFCGLERRTGRSGKDSIAEPPGAHDDCCNVVAGVLVGLDLDRRPALMRQSDLMTGDKPAEHAFAEIIFATVWVCVDGMGAFVLFSYSERAEPPLIVLDFDLVPWSGSILPEVATRIDAECEAARERTPRGREGGVHALLHVQGQLFEPAVLAMQRAFDARLNRPDARRRTIDVPTIDPQALADPAGMILRASAHVNAGRVKLSATAQHRSTQTPLLGALAVAPGEAVLNNPLRVALLLGVAEMDAAQSQRPAAMIQFA